MLNVHLAGQYGLNTPARVVSAQDYWHVQGLAENEI